MFSPNYRVGLVLFAHFHYNLELDKTVLPANHLPIRVLTYQSDKEEFGRVGNSSLINSSN
jgi:hypothetical protein